MNYLLVDLLFHASAKTVLFFIDKKSRDLNLGTSNVEIIRNSKLSQ